MPVGGTVVLFLGVAAILVSLSGSTPQETPAKGSDTDVSVGFGRLPESGSTNLGQPFLHPVPGAKLRSQTLRSVLTISQRVYQLVLVHPGASFDTKLPGTLL